MKRADDKRSTSSPLAIGWGLEVFCLLMLGCPDRTRQAVCDTLLRGWRELEQVPPSPSAKIWLYRLATDVCLEDLDGTDEPRGRRPFDGVRYRNEPSRQRQDHTATS